jgi:hypothetical protein
LNNANRLAFLGFAQKKSFFMNRRGLSCILLLAFLGIELAFLEKSIALNRLEAEAMAAAFEAEQACFSRTVLEENTDLLVWETLRQGLSLGLENEELKAAVNARLVAFFAESEKASGSSGISLEFLPESKSFFFLSENTSLIQKKAAGKGLEAEYCFTGGLLKNKEVKARVFGERVETEFRIPAGYCVKAGVP